MKDFGGHRLLMATALVSTAFAFSTLPAYAQDQGKVGEEQARDKKQAEYNAKGITVGSFKAFPKLDLSAVRDSNIYKEKTGETSDTIYHIKPSLSLRSDWNRHSLRFDASLDDASYASKSADDFTTYDLRARGKVEVSKAANVKLDLRHKTGAEARGGDDVGSDATAPVDTLTQTVGADAEYKPNRLGITVGAKWVDYDYDDNQTTAGGTTNNDDRDRKDLEGYVRFGYDIQDGYEAYAKYTANDRDYNDATDDNGVNRDSDGYNAQAGLAVDLSKLLRADLAVGYMAQDYTDASLKDASGWSADANVRWSVTPLTAIRGTVSRTISETTTSGVSATVGTNYGVGVDHEFMRNLTAKADVKFANTDYEGDTTNNRSDDKTTYTLAVDYKLNRMFFAGAKASYEKRDSNVDTNDYSRTQYTANIGVQF